MIKTDPTRLPERDKLRETIKYPGRPKSIPVLLACTEFVLSTLNAGDDVKAAAKIIRQAVTPWHTEVVQAALLAARIASGAGEDRRKTPPVCDGGFSLRPGDGPCPGCGATEDDGCRYTLATPPAAHQGETFKEAELREELETFPAAHQGELDELRDFKRRTEEAFQLTCAISKPEEIVGLWQDWATEKERADQLEAELDDHQDDLGLHHAYLRLRAMIPGAFNTPHGPTPEQVWKTTEDALANALCSIGALPTAHQGEPSENMAEALRQADLVIDRCLAVIEYGLGPPNWDWLREVRKQVRDALRSSALGSGAVKIGDAQPRIVGADDGGHDLVDGNGKIVLASSEFEAALDEAWRAGWEAGRTASAYHASLYGKGRQGIEASEAIVSVILKLPLPTRPHGENK